MIILVRFCLLLGFLNLDTFNFYSAFSEVKDIYVISGLVNHNSDYAWLIALQRAPSVYPIDSLFILSQKRKLSTDNSNNNYILDLKKHDEDYKKSESFLMEVM